MSLRQPARLMILCLLLAWLFDQLFWRKPPGLSFPLFVLLLLAAGFYLTRQHSLVIPRASQALVPLVLFFALFTALRQEAFTQATNYLLTLGLLILLATTWLGGRWLRYSLSDYLLQPLRLVGGSLGGLPRLLRPTAESEGEPEAKTRYSLRQSLRLLASVLVGLLLALPVVALLAALLSSADPVFSERLQEILRYFDLERLTEYIFRLGYILVGAYLLVGVYLFSLLDSANEKLVGLEKPWFPPFLGWLEALVVLLCVDLLFAFFVVIQFQYFFGGQANINLAGYTYSEYARRGFGELVAVAFISLLLFLGLGMLARRQPGVQRKGFSAAGITLVGLVLVILVSAFQRLTLYEAAYGFTVLRTLPHIFILWLGALLLATAVLEAFNRMRGFALALVVACLGFGLTLNLLNVEAFIVRQNLDRQETETDLDVAYLGSLSEDALPALAQAFQDPALPEIRRDQLGAALACRKFSFAEAPRVPWPSLTWPILQARQTYMQLEPALQAYPVRQLGSYSPEVKVNGAWQECWPYRTDD